MDSEVRLKFLAEQLDREVSQVEAWSSGWGSLYAATALTQAGLLPAISDRGIRIDLTVGALSAALGSTALLGLPLRVTLPLKRARAHWNDTDRCRLLAEAEDALQRSAGAQRLSSSWIPHAGNVAFNVGLALILGLGYGRWKSAAISAGVGTLVGEANVLTQPHGLSDVLERYQKGELRSSSGISWSAAPWAGVDTAGIALRARY